MNELAKRLYISTIASDASALAAELGLGLEIAEYCTAWNMDELFPETHEKVIARLQKARRVTFHAPYSDLSPAAVDPRVRQVTRERYRQAIALAQQYGAEKVIIHSGFIPQVYFPEWFTVESVRFWQDFLPELPEGMTVCLENVMETAPEVITEVVRTVDDPRLRLCLDIGHAHTHTDGTPPEAWIETMCPWLSHVHLHDNRGDRDAHMSLGAGTIPVERILRQVLTVEDITFTIENREARPSVVWLKEHAFL